METVGRCGTTVMMMRIFSRFLIGAHLWTLLAQSGRKVEVTTPVAPGVDVNLARELAMSLGSCVEFRTREYFP